MNTRTQTELVRNLLLEDYKRGSKGLNSVYIRNTYFIVDVATRVFDNKKYFRSIGLIADKRLEKNKTATYFLRPIGQTHMDLNSQTSTDAIETPIQPRKEKEAWQMEYEKYIGKDGRTYWRPKEGASL